MSARPRGADESPAGPLTLRADCERCFGLCCVALPFSASADFAHDKAAGDPCRHLQPGFSCGIHGELRERGFPGCAVYDCFGAGQHVSALTFQGRSWREAPQTAASMFAVFTVMRQLHELAFYLTEALTLVPARSVHAVLVAALEAVERHTGERPESLAALDVAALRRRVGPLLRQASELTRAEARHVHRARTPGATPARGGAVRAGADLVGGDLVAADLVGGDLVGADLVGADLRGADLVGADLRGAYLIAADLRGADARAADLLGADLRDADLRGADLREALFVSQSQLGSARGDGTTALPTGLDRPRHWSGQSR